MESSLIESPEYIHDCGGCVFLGKTIGRGKLVDCYYHENQVSNRISLIARYSNEPSDYASTLLIDGSPIPMGHAELYACLGFYCAKKGLEMPKITFRQAHGGF